MITTDLVAQTEFTNRTDNLLPDTEVVQQDLDGNGSVDFQRTFVRQYDGLLRSTGYVLEIAPTTTEQSVTYGYEADAGRYASVAAQTLSGPVNTFTYSYDAARPGLLSTVAGPAHTVTNTWEADRDILDTKTNTATVSGSTVVSSFDYAVNSIGQRTGVAATGTAFAASSGWTWSYDSLGQVTSAAHTGNTALNQGYDYDDIGNRTQSSVGLSSPAVTSYTANMLNQYSAITGASAPAVNPSYDADGNQLAGAAGQALGQTFEWDGENRLKVVKDGLGNVLITYGYDAQSRRVRRTTATGSTLYVYDGWNCVGEHTVPSASTTATLSRTFAWGLDVSGSLQGAGGVGGLLNVVDVGASTIVYPVYDGNGNVSEYLDGSGAVLAHFEYDAFGRTVVATGTTTGIDIRFSTKPQDDVTGWHYYGYRFYDAVAGRWVSRDPIEETGGINIYGMGRNNAPTAIDYLGFIVVFEKPPYNFSDPRMNVNSRQWEDDFEEMKKRLQDDLSSLEECCKKEAAKLGSLGVCKAIADTEKKYPIKIQPRDWRNKGVPSRIPAKDGGYINWPVPNAGPDATQGHEVYSDDGKGGYSVSDQANGTLLTHEFEHLATDRGKSTMPSSDPSKYPSEGEEAATDAENQIRKCCPKFKGPLRDSYLPPSRIRRQRK